MISNHMMTFYMPPFRQILAPTALCIVQYCTVLCCTVLYFTAVCCPMGAICSPSRRTFALQWSWRSFRSLRSRMNPTWHFIILSSLTYPTGTQQRTAFAYLFLIHCTWMKSTTKEQKSTLHSFNALSTSSGLSAISASVNTYTGTDGFWALEWWLFAVGRREDN